MAGRAQGSTGYTAEGVCRAARTGTIPGGIIENGKLHIDKLRADTPEGAEDLVLDLYQQLPPARITDLLLEVDERTGFSEAFTHLRTGAPCSDRIGLMNVLLAEGVNLGLRKMAAATNTHSFWELLRIARWHVEGSAYDRALAMIVEAHAALPMAAFWGQGQSASSDGQFFLATEQGEAMNLINAKYGNVPGLKGYSHVSDQYAPFATQVIPATVSEAPYILDGLLMNDAGRRVRQHFADTGGFTDHVFAACALLGYRFAPVSAISLRKDSMPSRPTRRRPMCERWSEVRSMNRSSSATGPTSCASWRRSQRGSSPPARFFASSPLPAPE
jgi:hypothetical protein